MVGAIDSRLFGAGLPPVPSIHRGRVKAALVVETLPVLCVIPMLIWIAFSTVDRSASIGGYARCVTAADGARRCVGPPWPGLSPGGSLARWCATSLFVLLVPALVVILAGAWGAVRPELFRRRRTLMALWFAPPLSVIAAFVLGIFRGSAARTLYGTEAHPLLAAVLGDAAFLALGLLVASAIAIAIVVGRIGVSVDTLKFGVKVGRRLSVAVVLATVAVIGWATGLALQGVPKRNTSYDITRATLAPWSPLLAVGMVVVAVLVTTACVQARRSWRVATALEEVEVEAA
jgi:hypothetical protein